MQCGRRHRGRDHAHEVPTATIQIANVKRKAGSAYGATKTYAVGFDVLDRKADRITIKGVHTFPRLDFGIGTDPAMNGEEQVGCDVTIEVVLTIANT